MRARPWFIAVIAAAGLLLTAGVVWRWPAVAWGTRAVRAVLLVPIRAIHAGTTAVSNGAQFIAAIRDLHRENLALRADNRALSAERVRLSELLSDTESLRREFGLAGSVRFRLLAAHVIGRDPQLMSGNFIIDRGRRDGVAEGLAVIAPGDVLVGRVVRADDRSASVLVLTDPTSSVNAVSEESRATGIVRGARGLDLRLELVEPGRELKPGEGVLTSGQDGLYPRGLTIGRIAAVEQQASGVLTTATVALTERLDRLETVLVILAAAPFREE